MPTPWLSRGLLLAAAAGVFAAARAGAVREFLLPPPPAAEARLDEVLPEVHLRAGTLAEALDALRRQTGAKIVFDPSVLGEYALWSLELDVRHVTLRQVLDQVFGASHGDGWPVYTTDGGVVVVTNPATLRHFAVTRIYDVRDLLPGDANPPALPPKPAPPGICFPSPQSPNPRAAAEGMVNTITLTVAAESWDVNGGVPGTIHELDGRLVVSQTPENHRQLARLLKGLRAVPGAWRSYPYVSVGPTDPQLQMR